MVDFVIGLAVIQASAGIVREVTSFSDQDIANVFGGAALLRGAEIPIPRGEATMTVVAGASLEVRHQLTSGPLRVEQVADAPFQLNVCGTIYPIGRRYSLKSVSRVAPSDIQALLVDTLVEDRRLILLPDPDEPWALVQLVE